MQIRNTRKNEIIIRLSDDCSHIEAIDLYPRAFRLVDSIAWLLARSFKVSNWGALRHLVQYNGMPIVQDARKALEGK